MQKTEQTEKKFHSFTHVINTIALPEKFTYPFHYTPHPLCVEAAKEVQAYLTLQQQWQAELQQGKMFGVLIVQNETGAIGFLAAFSGMLDGKTDMLILFLRYTTYSKLMAFSNQKKNIYLL